VLVSGLGLGCVVRGLLARPAVLHVDVLEIDATILRLIGPEFAANPRVTLIQADARCWRPPDGTHYDFAWHDIWHAEESWHVIHAHLIERYQSICDRQGAWQFPREIKRLLRGRLVGGYR
jgi:predicted membrane-bound spermidine synthase